MGTRRSARRFLIAVGWGPSERRIPFGPRHPHRYGFLGAWLEEVPSVCARAGTVAFGTRIFDRLPSSPNQDREPRILVSRLRHRIDERRASHVGEGLRGVDEPELVGQ